MDAAAPRTPAQVAELAADPAFRTARSDVPIDTEALRVARRVVEDALVTLRDIHASVLPAPGNGLVIRPSDSPGSSSIIRLTTNEALSMGIKAYLAALAAPPVAAETAPGA